MSAIRGSVTDPSGSIIPNVAVRATVTSGAVRAAVTDAQGQYLIAGLAPGTYSIHAEASGFAPFEQAGIEVQSGTVRALDISLTVLTQAQQVTVAADGAVPLDTEPSNNAGALVLQKAELDALPEDRDDLTADLQALAGPAAGPGGGQFFIDGFTGGRLPPKQSIREIRINQNPFAAQFDRPGQGRVEIFTKPGSEQFHGEILFQFGDEALNSRNPFLASRPPYQRRQWESEVGGPLGKKTSFRLDFERRDVKENAFVNAVVLDTGLNAVPFTQGIVTPATSTEVNGRLDRQLTSNHTMTVRYGLERDTNDNTGAGGFSLAERAYAVRTSEHSFQILETGVLNATMVNETRFRLRRERTAQSGGTNTPVITVLDAFSAGGSAIGNSYDNRTRYEIQNFTSAIQGLHTIKFGGVARVAALDTRAEQNYAGTFTFTSLDAWRQTLLGIRQNLSPAQIRESGGGASQFTLTAGNAVAGVNQTDVGLFAQDDWKVRPQLTLSAGLRYEAQTNSGNLSNFAPRIGFAWAPGNAPAGGAKYVVRGGFGIFYDRLSETLTLDALRQDGVRQQRFLLQNPDFYPNQPTPDALTAGARPQTIRRADANWHAPMMLQSSIGVERQFPRHVTVALNYLHTRGLYAVRSRNINAPLPGGAGLPYGGSNAIYLYETSGLFRQNQLLTTVTARMSSGLTFSGSYVYGTAFSNTDGVGTFPANQYDLSGEFGRAAFNVRHRLQLNGSWSPRWGLRFSPFLTIASGRPYNITTGRDNNADSLFTDRPGIATDPSLPGVRRTPFGLLNLSPAPGDAILIRNAGTGPGLIAANIRLSKAFNLGQHEPGKDASRQVVISVNARNFLNRPNLATPNGNMSSPLFGQSASLVSGSGGGAGNRRIDLQVRFTF